MIGLPQPPAGLSWEDVTLDFVTLIAGEPERGFVPYYHFRITTDWIGDAGYINFRIGDTRHVMMFAGHIGYQVHEPCRGQRLALAACQAIRPFVKEVYPSVIITCDPDNTPSRRTIERLGACFLGEVPVPPEEPAYDRGSRFKRRYQWMP